MKKLLLFLILSTVTILMSAQDELLVVSDSLFQDNIIFFGGNDGWRFHPGDDLRWADPNFDDSAWSNLIPSGMKEPIPDSLWQGYGWFRLRFAADSTITNKIWSLYFSTWGAADVYLDGQLVQSYGRFSSDPRTEVRYMPERKLYPLIVLAPKQNHVLAVRFSYHKSPLYKKIMGKRSGNFGFEIDLEYSNVNHQIILDRESRARIVYISSAMLLVIILLHGFLFLLFPAQRSNLYIAIIAALLFAHCITSFGDLFFELDRLSYFLVIFIPFILLLAAAFSLFPTTLSIMFGQKPLLIHRILLLSFPVLTISLWVFDNIQVYMLIGFALLVIYLSIRILARAFRHKEKGVWFVAIGFLGAILSPLLSIFFSFVISSNYWGIQYLLIALMYVSLPLGMTLFMSYRFYTLFTSLEVKVVERTEDLKRSLDDLRATQAQLIQSEKMASLGELTAGIAHEIQNPLNFVNNFSEVSVELIEEMQDELAKGDFDEAKAISSDIKQNLEKINHHGKRADAIVKGMLEHSRTNGGEKVPTEINALADEYLRLSYHGLRAKDKSFNADFETAFDPHLPKINVVPQDIGRVLLNLINNAFQAVQEVDKPKIIVSTRKIDDGIQISVSDNGRGIPDAIKEKIFQPFFTTKPTGQGTGLGLSLSYDIVKTHGGELKVVTKEGKGSEFIISLPIV